MSAIMYVHNMTKYVFIILISHASTYLPTIKYMVDMRYK